MRANVTAFTGWFVAATLVISVGRSSTAFGDDLTTQSGKTYHEFRVTGVEPDGVSGRHRDGVVKIPFSELSEEFRKKYGYEPQKAEAYSRERREQSAASTAATAQADRDKARVDTFRKSGLPASIVITQVLPEGILGEGTFFADAGYKVRDEYGSRRAGTFHGLGFIFVRTGIKGLADGDTWSGTLWPAGTYRYGATNGATKTVRQYAASPEEALAILDREKSAGR